jgi:glycine oxidase
VVGLIYATGHHRNGILLTPITAELITALVLDGNRDHALAPFAMTRFRRAEAAE